MNRVCMAIKEIQELRAKETAKVLNAINEINKIEKLLKDGNLKYTKEILYKNLNEVINIGKD